MAQVATALAPTAHVPERTSPPRFASAGYDRDAGDCTTEQRAAWSVAGLHTCCSAFRTQSHAMPFPKRFKHKTAARRGVSKAFQTREHPTEHRFHSVLRWFRH